MFIPELLAEEIDHLGKVLRYNNYPNCMMKQGGRNNSPAGRLIDPETGNEVKKTVFISAPYFPGLSESFKQLFRYTHMFRFASRVKTPLNQCSCIQKTKLILPSKRILSMSGLALNQVANLLTLGRPPGHSVNVLKNTARKGPILPYTNIVTLKAIHSPMLINSKSQIRKSLKLPVRQKRQYTFERKTLNSIEMSAKWLSPMYLIQSWV